MFFCVYEGLTFCYWHLMDCEPNRRFVLKIFPMFVFPMFVIPMFVTVLSVPIKNDR